ncbi:hypothetical protein VMT65_31220 [Nocardia sp. CDC153]|uniref:hypothetical protein n=1 Tax=Nocardia sp. CDC153 TaxID=3112167 RepID=UPI002DB5A938|nr:hypothetical protein [Nocardia sp. CDC153]MEC3957541.1 hypothetical protein [Nocardia sp. CDC153]
MSDNASELDQITHDASHLGRTVLQLISTWRLMNPNATRVPRSVRRDINQLLKADRKEREFAHGQERVRVERSVREFQWKLLHDSAVRPWDTQQSWFDRQRELAIAHERLRGQIHLTTHLSATERGQAARALTHARQNPQSPIGRVFGKPRGLDALRARLHDGFTRLRAGLANPTEQQQIHRWQQQRHDRSAPGRRGIESLDPLYNFDPNQPIDLVPTEMAASTAQSAPGQPQHQRTGIDRDPRGSAPEVPIDPGEPMEVVHGRGNPEAYEVYVISEADATGTDRKVESRTVSNPIEAVDWAQQRLDGHGSEVKVLVYPAGPGHEYHAGRPVYSVQGRTDVIAAQLRDDVTSWKMTSPQPGNPTGQNPNQAAPQQDPARANTEQNPSAGHADVEHNPGYRVAVGTAEFAAKHPDMVEHADVATLTAGYTWALDQLGDDHKGWPADGDVVVRIHDRTQKPLHTLTGPRGMAIDEVIGWQEHHEHSPLAHIEALQTELQAARAEVDQLRTENTDLVRKFAEHSPTENGPAAPAMPTGPRLAQPIFAAPVLNQPILNGLDR